MRTNAAVLSVVSALVFLTAPCAALADPDPALHSVTLYAYGLFSPELIAASGNSGSSWGGGAGIRWDLNDRWALGLDASSIRVDGTTVRPVTLGFLFGPAGAARLRPWIEGGVGYYERDGFYGRDRGLAYSSAGNLRDLAEKARLVDLGDAAGGYFGLGLDLRLSSRLALSAGARTHTWVPVSQGPVRLGNWDGMAAVRSGLSYRF